MKKGIMAVLGLFAAAALGGIDIKPVMIGDPMPQAALTNVKGDSFDLLGAAQDHPLALVFYRGSWCPYCTRHLAQLKELEPKLRKLGYQMILISPDRYEKVAECAAKIDAGFTMLSDASMKTAWNFGIAYPVTDQLREKLKEHNIDLEESSGQTHHMLPVPSVFLIDTDGYISFSYINPDFTSRIDPAVFLAAAKSALKAD